MYETTVLIVGAGPTGLTLAVDLARRGIPLRIIEAAATPFPGSRGKGIQPRSLEVLADLGVIDQILEVGSLYPKFRIHVGPLSFRAGSLGTYRQATEDVPFPNLWMVPQATTEKILRERLRTLGAEVEFGTKLLTFAQNEHAVTATLSTGEILETKFLIGCDGGHSTVRKLLDLRLHGETIDEKSIVVADVEVEKLGCDDWHLWPFSKLGVVGLCPLPSTSLFQLTMRAIPETMSIEEAVFKATGCRVNRISWQSFYKPAVRMVDRYRVGRVLLAGDAAHTHPPSGGQGLNTGVQDAYNLGWKLAHVLRGAPDSLLDTYEAERLPIAAEVLGLSKRLLQTRSIRRGDITNQLRLHYRTSPLSSGIELGGLHPGDRMPDGRLDSGATLFDHLRGTHATELILPDGLRILIRPDGYIGHIGSTHFDEYGGEPTHQVMVKGIKGLIKRRT